VPRATETAQSRGAKGTVPVPVVAPALTGIEIAVVVVAIIAIVAAARIAEPFLVPVVAGILLSYTLRPLVSLLERARLPRLLAASLVMFALVAVVSASLFAIAGEFNNAVATLPAAARKLRHVAADLGRSQAGPVTNMKVAAAELDRAAAEATGKPAHVEPTTANATTQIQSWIAEQSAHVATIVVQLFMAGLLTLFLLAAGDTFRRKMARLAGESLVRRRVTVEVLNEIDAQIQRYMATLLVTNVLIAVLTWTALSITGLPNAGMWGVVTGLLHVIPYAGTLVAAVAVGVAALTEFGILSDVMVAMAAVILVAEAIGLLFATWLQGRTARMNPVATFVGVMFFGWLWGAWGLLLGMPILAVLNAISDRVEAMKPLREFLGN
jgi:predicted PurR-regulated permease PerM